MLQRTRVVRVHYTRAREGACSSMRVRVLACACSSTRVCVSEYSRVRVRVRVLACDSLATREGCQVARERHCSYSAHSDKRRAASYASYIADPDKRPFSLPHAHAHEGLPDANKSN